MSKRILVAAVAVLVGSASPARQLQILLGPDFPAAYLSGLRETFQQFHDRYHYYPKTWYDITVNCTADPRQPGCSPLLRGPTGARTSVNPFGPGHVRSKYTYVITASGANDYRIEVRDSRGKAVFYSDRKHVAIPIR